MDKLYAAASILGALISERNRERLYYGQSERLTELERLVVIHEEVARLILENKLDR